MRGLRIVWAGLVGWMVDNLLTTFIVGGGMALANINQTAELDFTRPLHIILGLVLPILMTVIGGGVAGAVAPEDPTPAGALVGGIGLIMMSVEGLDMTAKHSLTFVLAQCGGVVGAAIAATVVAARRRSRI